MSGLVRNALMVLWRVLLASNGWYSSVNHRQSFWDKGLADFWLHIFPSLISWSLWIKGGGA